MKLPTLSPARKAVVYNTASQLAGKAISAASTIFVSFLIARGFGASAYGEFVKVTTYIAFFYLLSDFGINAMFLKRNDPFPVLLGLRLVGSVILTFLALAILAVLPGTGTTGYTTLARLGIVVFAPSIIFQAMITTANALFQKYLRYDLATLAIFAGSLVTIFFVWLTTGTAASGTGILLSIIALLLGAGVTGMVALFLAKRFASSLVPEISPVALTPLFLSAIPLGVTLLFNLVYFHVDSVILTLYRTSAEVGIYGLAYKVFELPLVIPTFFMNAVYPLLLREQHSKLETGNAKFLGRIKVSALLLLVAACVLGWTLWFAAPLLTWVKEDFTASIPALRVLSLGFPFFFLSALTMWTLIALGKQKLLVMIYGVSMIINISLNWFLVPTYGYMAAAWITVGSEGVVFFLSGIVLLRALSVAETN